MGSLAAERPTRRGSGTKPAVIASIVVGFGVFWGIMILDMDATLHGGGFFSAPSGLMVHDVADFWGGARLFWLHRLDAVFDPGLFNAWLATQLAPGSAQDFATWSYPPTMLLAVLPIGLLPLPIACLVWDALMIVVLAFTLRLVAPSRSVLLTVLVGPAAMYSLHVNQNGGLTSSLFIGAIWLVDRRPILAGICAGLFVIKPQLAVLLPFAFAAAGYWRAFLTAAVTAVTLLAVSAAVFGIGAWEGFITQTTPAMTEQLRHAYGIPPQWAMPTTWVTLQSWGAGIGAASLGQMLSTATAGGLVIWAWRQRGIDRRLRNALTCALPLLATPFGYTYDAIPVTLTIAILAHGGIAHGFSRLEAFVLPVTWIWLAVGTVWCMHDLPSLGAVLLLAVAWCVVRRIQRGDDLAPVPA